MTRRIGVSKAARMIGVTRAQLNRRLTAAGIPTFEGEVDFERVRCIAPELSLDASAMVEKVSYIRDNPTKALGVPGEGLGRDDLEDEVRRLSTSLMVESRRADNYRTILDDVVAELGRLQVEETDERRDMAFELCSWLRARLTVN